MTTTTMFASTMSSSTVEDRDEYVTSAPMDKIIVQKLASWLVSIRSLIQDVVQLCLHPPFSFESLRRVSIILLLFERILRPLGEATFTKQVTQSQHTIIPVDHHHVEADQLGFFLAISFAYLLTRSDGVNLVSNSVNQDYLIILAILFSIVCLESFLPLALWGLISLLLFKAICWETTLSVLVLSWLGALIWFNMA
jgi:hypothetical protein